MKEGFVVVCNLAGKGTHWKLTLSLSKQQMEGLQGQSFPHQPTKHLEPDLLRILCSFSPQVPFSDGQKYPTWLS